tara:strand:- start:549 stop:1592 length:1044 start_codon:yes stop_codon:yes gene_type:complete
MGEIGHLLLSQSKPFEAIAEIVRYHESPWDEGDNAAEGKAVPFASHVVHLANQVEQLIDPMTRIPDQVQSIRERILDAAERRYHPEAILAFVESSLDDGFWLDLTRGDPEALLAERVGERYCKLTVDDLTDFAHLLGLIVDFNRDALATHSFAVAAAALGRYAGLEEARSRRLEVASYLNSLGKLTVPQTVRDRRIALNAEERDIVRSNIRQGSYALEETPGLRELGAWAADHDGEASPEGYPFHLQGDAVSLEARIMAVANRFVALTEDRPYRPALSLDDAKQTLEDYVECEMIDGELVAKMIENVEEIDNARKSAAAEDRGIHSRFRDLVMSDDHGPAMDATAVA